MGWKDGLQLLDLALDARLEVTCRRCGDLRYETRAHLLSRGHDLNETLAETERTLLCRKYGCKGGVRIAMPHEGESPFVGGMA